MMDTAIAADSQISNHHQSQGRPQYAPQTQSHKRTRQKLGRAQKKGRTCPLAGGSEAPQCFQENLLAAAAHRQDSGVNMITHTARNKRWRAASVGYLGSTPFVSEPTPSCNLLLKEPSMITSSARNRRKYGLIPDEFLPRLKKLNRRKSQVRLAAKTENRHK